MTTSTSGDSLALTLRARSVASTLARLWRSSRRSSKSSRANALTIRAEEIDSWTTEASSLSLLLDLARRLLDPAHEAEHHHEQHRRDRQADQR